MGFLSRLNIIEQTANMLLGDIGRIKNFSKKHGVDLIDVNNLETMEKLVGHIAEYARYKSTGECRTEQARRFIEKDLMDKIFKMIDRNVLRGVISKKKSKQIKELALELYKSLICTGCSEQQVIKMVYEQIHKLLATISKLKQLEKQWQQEYEDGLRETLIKTQLLLQFLWQQWLEYLEFMKNIDFRLQELEKTIQILKELNFIYKEINKTLTELNSSCSRVITQADKTLAAQDKAIEHIKHIDGLTIQDKKNLMHEFRQTREEVVSAKQEIAEDQLYLQEMLRLNQQRLEGISSLQDSTEEQAKTLGLFKERAARDYERISQIDLEHPASGNVVVRDKKQFVAASGDRSITKDSELPYSFQEAFSPEYLVTTVDNEGLELEKNQASQLQKYLLQLQVKYVEIEKELHNLEKIADGVSSKDKMSQGDSSSEISKSYAARQRMQELLREKRELMRKIQGANESLRVSQRVNATMVTDVPIEGLNATRIPQVSKAAIDQTVATPSVEVKPPLGKDFFKETEETRSTLSTQVEAIKVEIEKLKDEKDELEVLDDDSSTEIGDKIKFVKTKLAKLEGFKSSLETAQRQLDSLDAKYNSLLELPAGIAPGSQAYNALTKENTKLLLAIEDEHAILNKTIQETIISVEKEKHQEQPQQPSPSATDKLVGKLQDIEKDMTASRPEEVSEIPHEFTPAKDRFVQDSGKLGKMAKKEGEDVPEDKDASKKQSKDDSGPHNT